MSKFVRIGKYYLALDKISALEVVSEKETIVHIADYDAESFVILDRQDAQELIDVINSIEPISWF